MWTVEMTCFTSYQTYYKTTGTLWSEILNYQHKRTDSPQTDPNIWMNLTYVEINITD